MTGVQTCALPICFPVTIRGGQEREEDRRERRTAERGGQEREEDRRERRTRERGGQEREEDST